MDNKGDLKGINLCEYCNKKMREWTGKKRSDFKERKNHLTCWIKKQEELKIIMLCDNIYKR